MGVRASFATAAALRRSIRRGLGPVLHAVGVEDHEVSCRLFGDVRALAVEIGGPAALRNVEQSIGVRVLDAVHAHGETFGTISVVVTD